VAGYGESGALEILLFPSVMVRISVMSAPAANTFPVPVITKAFSSGFASRSSKSFTSSRSFSLENWNNLASPTGRQGDEG